MAYQIDGDDEQNRMQVTFSSKGQTGNLGGRSKGQISLTCQFQRFLYHSVARVMPRGGTCGGLGESKTLGWGFAMAPHRLRALVSFLTQSESICPEEGSSVYHCNNIT